MNCYVSNYHHCYCCCHWHQQYIDIHLHLNFVVIIINKYWSAQLYIHRHAYKCIIAHTNNLTTRFVLNFVLRQWLTHTHYYRSTATGAIWNNIYEYESESPNMMNLLSINESPRKHKKTREYFTGHAAIWNGNKKTIFKNPTMYLFHIPQCTIQNKMCTFLFWMAHCGI